jgi:hypothetical protein
MREADRDYAPLFGGRHFVEEKDRKTFDLVARFFSFFSSPTTSTALSVSGMLVTVAGVSLVRVVVDTCSQ